MISKEETEYLNTAYEKPHAKNVRCRTFAQAFCYKKESHDIRSVSYRIRAP